MDPSVDRYRSRPPLIDFFISYSPTDEAWSTWIAWELEEFGYRVMLQAWDFVPGSNFIEFMDRGVSQSRAVIAILTESYLNSRYSRMEWQAALRAAPDEPESRLITVRVEECDLVGLLSTITFLDLARVADRGEARNLLLQRIQQALEGRAKPGIRPGFPPHRSAASAVDPPAPVHPARARRQPTRHAGVPIPFPPSDLEARQCSILHVAGPTYEKAHIGSGAGRHDAADLVRAVKRSRPHASPDVVLFSGSLANTGSIREFDEALAFVTGVRDELGVPHHHVAIVPGPQDITRAASAAYFASCEADDTEPEPPFWPKWRHYARFFSEVYASVDTAAFTEGLPWSLFPLPDLRIVVAGLNSTVADSHRASDHYGWLGVQQMRWFADELSDYLADHWLRIGLISHPPGQLRDSERMNRILGDSLSVIIHSAGDSTTVAHSRSAASSHWKTNRASSPGEASLLSIGVEPGGRGVSLESVTRIGEPGEARHSTRLSATNPARRAISDAE